MAVLGPMYDKEQAGWKSKNPRAEVTGATVCWDIPWQPLPACQASVCTSAKGEGQLGPSAVLPALLVCKLVQCPNLMGRKSEVQSRLKHPGTEQMRTFPCTCADLQ